jgi:ParB family chromosome partitioning protein
LKINQFKAEDVVNDQVTPLEHNAPHTDTFTLATAETVAVTGTGKAPLPARHTRSEPGRSPKIVHLELGRIREHPDHPRGDFEMIPLHGLAASIGNHGLTNPIVVMDAPTDGNWRGYFIVAGRRRYRAHELLAMHSITAIITRGDPDEIALIERVQHDDLQPLEEAEALAQLKAAFAYTDQELATAIGKSRSTVTNYLGIARLPQRIKDECVAGNRAITKSLLIEVSKAPTTDEKLRLWETIGAGTATVRATRSVKQRAHPRPPHSTTEQLDEALVAGREFVRVLSRASNNSLDDSATLEQIWAVRTELELLYDVLASRDLTCLARCQNQL